MIAHHLSLEYKLNMGWLTRYVDGLLKGEAIARSCTDCAKVSFPPIRVCECGGCDGVWETLAGTAKINLRTTGQDGNFALACFDGANTQTVLRLVNLKKTATRGRLLKSHDGSPALCLGPEEKDA